MSTDQEVSIRTLPMNNLETWKGAIFLSSPTVVYNTASLSANTDPFAGKTNKYAESRLLRFVGKVAFHINISTDGSAATTAHFYVPANEVVYIGVDLSVTNYVRIIDNDTDGLVQVAEIY